MSNVVPIRATQPARMSRQQFKEHVVRLVASGNLFVTRHLNRDHPERQISQAQIAKCLKMGTVQTEPFVNKFGNYQAEVYRHMAGEQMTVVAAIEWEAQVVVITAY